MSASMDSEIELKLLVSADAEKIIRKQFVPQLNIEFEHESTQLFNSYYDTADQRLRQHEMGLRIRGNNGEYEQTIKSRDGSVGGLHKRAEYNVALPANQLDLMAFPQEVWPEGLHPEKLKNELNMLFSTHFQREQYLLKLSDDAHVEMVFDAGEIETDKYQTPICEVELELKKGQSDSLFLLARQLLQVVPFRLGYKSKAQRGYELFKGEEAQVINTQVVFPIAREDSIQNAFVSLMGKAIQYWQFYEQHYVEHKKIRDLVAMAKVMRLTARCLKIFEQQLACSQLSELSQRIDKQLADWQWVEELAAIKELLSKKGFYRKKLIKNSEIISLLQTRQRELLDCHQPGKLLKHKSYILLQLDILELLTLQPWHSDDLAREPVSKFAKQVIKEELRHVVASFNQQEQGGHGKRYLENMSGLMRVVQLHTLFGNAVGNKTMQNMETWLDVNDGAEELRVLSLLEENLRGVLAESQDNLIEWCVEKQHGLLQVMELSRRAALNAAHTQAQ